MTGMSVEAFEDFVAQQGAAPRRWPANSRTAEAEALLLHSSEAQEILASHATLALALAPLSGAWPVPSSSLTERILEDAAAVTAERAAPQPERAAAKQSSVVSWIIAGWSRSAVLGPVAACAASAVFGLWLGLSAPAEMTDAASTTLVLEFDTPQEFAALFPWDLER